MNVFVNTEKTNFDFVKEIKECEGKIETLFRFFCQHRSSFDCQNLHQHVIIGVLGVGDDGLTELEVVLAGNDDGFDGRVLLHRVLPGDQLVVADLVELELVAEEEGETVGPLAPGPDHVVDEAWLVAVEEFRAALLELLLEDVESVAQVGDRAVRAERLKID